MEVEDLLAALGAGPRSAAELVEIFGISQPTLSRRVAAAGHSVVSFGAARHTMYAASRSIGRNQRFPVYRVSTRAQVAPVGEILPVAPSGYVVRVSGGQDGYIHGLPWWLQDMRPQGFLGRSFGKAHADALGLSDDINLWSDDHCLVALAERGEDFVGNLIIGDTALGRFVSQPKPSAVTLAERGDAYSRMAAAALSGEVVGSSAGGEQPKFTTYVEHIDGPRSVLVKFSAPVDNTISARWRSLLVAEHLAHETLREFGVAAAQSELVEFGNQMFLEIRRFDRVGSKGRRGIVSLSALDNQFVGRASTTWPAISAQLARMRHITAEASLDVQRLHAFGRLIGNTDMHNWNVAFVHDGDMPLALAPAFDMLPMQWAPSPTGFLRPVDFKVSLDPLSPISVWQEMLPPAIRYWKALSQDRRLDDDFRAAAANAHDVVANLASLLTTQEIGGVAAEGDSNDGPTM